MSSISQATNSAATELQLNPLSESQGAVNEVEEDKLTPLVRRAHEGQDVNKVLEAFIAISNSHLEKLKNFRDRLLALRLEIALSFASKMACYCEKELSIAPEDFHDIMGRDLIYARETNKSEDQRRLDYARHIAMAFNLAQFNPNKTEQHVTALVKVDLSKIDPKVIKQHFDNQKQAVERIRHYANTESLGFCYMNLFALPPAIGKLEKLIWLDLSSNQLTSLPPEIGKLVNLKHLDLQVNQLTTLPPEIGKLVNLTELNFSFNQLSALSREFVNLVNLYELRVPHNKLTTVPPEIWELVNLKELFLFDNDLSTLPFEIGKLVNLKNLAVKNNPLTTLPNSMTKLLHLELIWLDRTLSQSTQVQALLKELRKDTPGLRINVFNTFDGQL